MTTSPEQTQEQTQEQFRKAAPILKLIAFIFGATVGALIGGLVLSGFADAFVGNIEHLSWYCAAAGGLVGGVSTYRKAAAHLNRYEQLGKVAEELGLDYSAQGNSAADRELKAHLREMLASGGHTDIGNVLRKEVGNAVLVITDVHQVSRSSHGSSQASSSSVTTVAYFESPDLRWPTFAMQPEGRLLGLFAKIAGLQDIDFEDYPVFSAKYLLSGEDPEAIRVFFNASLLDYFTEHQGLEVRASENRLVMARPRHRCDPEKLGAFIQQAMEIFGLLMEAASSE